MGKELAKLDRDLLQAVRKCDLEKMRACLKQGADPNAYEAGEAIPRHLLNHVDEPETLVSMGYSLARPPLLLALLSKKEDLALELLAQGADPNLVSALGETATHLAARANSVKVLECLHEAKCKTDKADRSRSTPLMEACREGALEAVEWLLSHGAKWDRKNRDGETPLYIACSTCQPDIVKILLKKGADPNADTQFGPPIVAAVGACHQVPYTPGDIPYISTTWNDKGAFTYAPYPEEQILKIVQELLDHGAKPGGSKNRSPVGTAAQAGLLKVVQRLTEAGANPRTQDSMGNTPLDLAKMFKRDSVVEYLGKYTGSTKTKTQSGPKKKQPDFKASYAAVPKFKTKLQSKSCKAHVVQLAEACGSEPVFHENHVEVEIAGDLREHFDLQSLQDEYLSKDLFLFECTGSTKATKLALIPSNRWQDAIAVFQTNGINYDVASLDIIDWFEEWEEINPFRILGVSHDVVSGCLTGKVKKPKTFAKSMYALCPDTVEQGLGSLEELVLDLKENGQFFLWWD